MTFIRLFSTHYLNMSLLLLAKGAITKLKFFIEKSIFIQKCSLEFTFS